MASSDVDLNRFAAIRNLVRAVLRTAGRLSFTEVAPLEPAAGELLLKVIAAGVNRADLDGEQGLERPIGPLGLECAGVVVAVGAGVSRRWLERRVMCLLEGGGYAEQVVVHERLAIVIPERFSFEQAAASPVAFAAAADALYEIARLRPREVLLVHGAAGGVGSALVQLGRVRGARVVATASDDERCREVEALGAERCLNHRVAAFDEQLKALLGQAPVQVLADPVGQAFWASNLTVLAERGRLLSLGTLGGTRALVDLQQLLDRGQLVMSLPRPRALMDRIALTQRFLRSVLPLLEAGLVRPVVDRVYSPAEVEQAHARLVARHNFGKIVLRLQAG